jgi:uncharacterized protein
MLSIVYSSYSSVERGAGNDVGRDILVDGYNVIKRSELFQGFSPQQFAAARDALVTQLAHRYLHTPHRVTVVFDGNAPHEQVSHERRIRVIYSRAGETADQVIVRLAAQAREDGRDVEIFSDDLEVRSSVRKVGGSALSTQQLTHHLNAPPTHLKRQAARRRWARQHYGLDPSGRKDDDLDDAPPAHTRKKKKHR